MSFKSSNNKKIAIHLSHTNIESDSRILKETEALHSCGYTLVCIGAEQDDSEIARKRNAVKPGYTVITLTLRFKKLRVPKIFRTLKHLLVLAELNFRMFFSARSHRAQVIHCHDTYVLPAGFLLKKLTGAKLIYDAHELESNRNGSSRLYSKMIFFIESRLWGSIDRLIVVSDSISDWYQKNIGPKQNETILNSPSFDPSQYSAKATNYLREKFSISKGKVFVYFGLLSTGRGIEKIIESFKEISVTSTVVFIGYGDLAKVIQETSKTHENIFYHPPVHHSDLIRIGKSADCGFCLVENVSLSDYYSLPNKLFEYAFSGIPVIASKLPEIEKIVTEFNLGCCTGLSTSEIVNSVKAVEISNKKTIDAQKLSALSWDAQSKKLIQLYDKL